MKKLNVIWITSYPKSGNTWLHNVIKRAGKDYGFPQGDMDVYRISTPGICDAVRQEYTYNPCTVLKTHSVYKFNKEMHHFDGITFNNVGFIHISRNPLDVLLSYINFTRMQYKNQINARDEVLGKYVQDVFIDLLGFDKIFGMDEWQGMTLDLIPRKNLDHALDFFSEHGLNLINMSNTAGSWITHIESWRKAHQDMKGLSIRYEDCLVDPDQFAKATQFFIFNREDVLKSLDDFNTTAQKLASTGSIFYNKMEAYYFKSYFSKDAISRFMKKHENTLKNHGYASLLNMI